MATEKKTVFLATGALYLFWATGLYYLWELSKNYRVVLIVNNDYATDKIFLKAVSLSDVAEILYIPELRSMSSLHRFYYREFKRIALKYRPVLIFQYNNAYISNVYLFYMKKVCGLNCGRVVFQNGRMALNWEEDFRCRVSSAVSCRGAFFGRRIAWLSRFRLRTGHWLDEFRTYYFVPLFVARRWFVPVLDLYSGEFRKKGPELEALNRERFDCYLAYYECEKNKMESLQVYAGDIRIITHPVNTVGHECNRAVYECEQEELISIFPTYGLVSQLSALRGVPIEEIASEVADKWIAVITVLLQKFPGFTAVWKLHPSSANDSLMLDITRRVEKGCDKLRVLAPSENAQMWMLRSRVVVTDISTIFWWANLLQDKIVVSLDLFGYPNGDEARYYEGVLYFRTVAELKACDFSRQSGLKPSKPAYPTLTEISCRLTAGLPI